MRTRLTFLALVALATTSLTACTSGDKGEDKPSAGATKTVTADALVKNLKAMKTADSYLAVKVKDTVEKGTKAALIAVSTDPKVASDAKVTYVTAATAIGSDQMTRALWCQVPATTKKGEAVKAADVKTCVQPVIDAMKNVAVTGPTIAIKFPVPAIGEVYPTKTKNGPRLTTTSGSCDAPRAFSKVKMGDVVLTKDVPGCFKAEPFQYTVH